MHSFDPTENYINGEKINKLWHRQKIETTQQKEATTADTWNNMQESQNSMPNGSSKTQRTVN